MAKKKKKDLVAEILKALGKEGSTQEMMYEVADNGGYFSLGVGVTLLAGLDYYWSLVALTVSAILFIYKWHVYNKLHPKKRKKKR